MVSTARPTIGIALGGGAARGWAHIGVLKSLIAAGLEPDIVAGTSIGAVAGACFVTGRLNALEDFACGLTRRRIFVFLDFNFAGSGLITGQRLSTRLEQHLQQFNIEQLERRFVAMATELGTGHEVWLNKGSLVNALKASFALPGIFRPVQINGRWLIDGALVNPVPVSAARALGARLVIAVNVNTDLYGRGTTIYDHGASDEPTIEEEVASRGLLGRFGAEKTAQRRFFGTPSRPGISTVMVEAFNIMQDRLTRARLAGDPPDVLLSPRLGRIGLFDFHRADEIISLGAEAAERALEGVDEVIAALA